MSPNPLPEPLNGMPCVVTGASRGIGFAIARALVARGARVVLIARNAAGLADAQASLGDQATTVPCDVAVPAEVDAAIRRIRAAVGGAPRILVNNAGAFAVTAIDDVEPGALAHALDTNIVAPLRFVHAFLPEMRARGDGHIVTIGSVADRTVFPGNAAYAASKFGMRALHEALRLETRGSGVRATLVSPGPVNTPLWDAIDPDHREGFTPRAKMLDAMAVADAVIYAVTQPPTVNVDELRLSRS